MLGRSLRSLPTAQARGRPVPGACCPLSPPPRGLAAPSPASAQRLPQTPQVRTHLRPPLPRGGWYHPRCGWPGRQALPGRGAAAAGDAQWVYGERGAPSLFKSWGPYGPPPRSPPRSLSQALAACLAAVAGAPPRLAGDPQPAAVARGADSASCSRLPVLPSRPAASKRGYSGEKVPRPPREASPLLSPEGGVSRRRHRRLSPAATALEEAESVSNSRYLLPPHPPPRQGPGVRPGC